MLRIATRGSDLALAQAVRVQSLLASVGLNAELRVIKTRGDIALDLKLSDNLDKGLFTSEVEAAVADGRADLAVHSLKDMPTVGAAGCSEPIVIERAAVEDLLLVAPGAVVPEGDLPLRLHARVGTSAARRAALLGACRADLLPVPIRGNVPTRVRKLADGEVDGLILARAGLHRLQLDLTPFACFILDPRRWLPAPGQGAIAVQTRAGDVDLMQQLHQLVDPQARQAVAIEREALGFSEGGCHVPFGAYAEPGDEGAWCLRVGRSWGPGDWRMKTLSGKPGPLATRAHDMMDEAMSVVLDGCWSVLDGPP